MYLTRNFLISHQLLRSWSSAASSISLPVWILAHAENSTIAITESANLFNKHTLAKVRRNKVLTMTERGSGSVSALLLRDCILTKWTKFWASNIGGGALKAVVLVTTARSGHSPGAQLGCWKANMLKSKGPENACKIKLPHRVYALKEHSQC